MPGNLDLAGAAPLLCAGTTTHSPLRRRGAGKGKKVGVVGLGGLGHMGVKVPATLMFAAHAADPKVHACHHAAGAWSSTFSVGASQTTNKVAPVGLLQLWMLPGGYTTSSPWLCWPNSSW